MTGIKISRIFAAASGTRQKGLKVRSRKVFKIRFSATENNKRSYKEGIMQRNGFRTVIREGERIGDTVKR